eukprot:16452337-Heterocapsa_arctica.AAC.2
MRPSHTLWAGDDPDDLMCLSKPVCQLLLNREPGCALSEEDVLRASLGPVLALNRPDSEWPLGLVCELALIAHRAPPLARHARRVDEQGTAMGVIGLRLRPLCLGTSAFELEAAWAAPAGCVGQSLSCTRQCETPEYAQPLFTLSHAAMSA